MEAFDQFKSTESYIASEELKHAVNVAVALGRPLLLRGEPGTGKTLLAENLARTLELPLIRWHVKSTTKARDGLYIYDTVARLYDSRFGGDVNDIAKYIKLGPLGEALSAPGRVVLLIGAGVLVYQLRKRRRTVQESVLTPEAQQRAASLLNEEDNK